MDKPCLKGLINSSAGQHFTQLYRTEVPFKDQALDSLDQMPVADHLNNHPNLSTVASALRSIKLSKTCNCNSIPPDILKLDIPCLTSETHWIMCLCWEERHDPSRHGRMLSPITLFKNKKSRQDCNNHQTISLLKLFGYLFVGKSSWAESRYSQTECIPKVSVVSEWTDQQLTWYSHWDFLKRNI